MADVVKVAGYVPVTRQVLEDAAHAGAGLEEAFDRHLHPWRYPDANPMPYVDVFPRISRIAVTPRRLVDEWLLRRDHRRHCTCEEH